MEKFVVDLLLALAPGVVLLAFLVLLAWGQEYLIPRWLRRQERRHRREDLDCLRKYRQS